MYLSQKQIKDYQNFGVIIVKDIFNEWIEPLRKGFQKVLDKPSKHGRENVNDNKGRFFEVGPGLCRLYKTFLLKGWTCQGLEPRSFVKLKGIKNKEGKGY